MAKRRRRRSGTTWRRRTRARRGRRRFGMSRVQRRVIPTSIVVNLKYSDRVTINPAAGGVVGTYSIRCNDCRDPDATGVGHQPMGFDQMMELYHHFTVLSSKITMKVLNQGSPLQYGIMKLRQETSITSTPSSFREHRNCKYAYGGDMDTRVNKGITHTYSTRKFFGATPRDHEFSGTVIASPTHMANYVLWIADAHEAVDISGTNVFFHLSMKVRFHEPVELSAS